MDYESAEEESENTDQKCAVFGRGRFVEHGANGSETACAGGVPAQKSDGAPDHGNGEEEETGQIKDGVSDETRERMFADDTAEVEDFKEDTGEGKEERPLENVCEPLGGITLHAVSSGEVEHGGESTEAEKEERNRGGGANPLLLDRMGFAGAGICKMLELSNEDTDEERKDSKEDKECGSGIPSAVFKIHGEVDAKRDKKNKKEVGSGASAESTLDNRGINAFLRGRSRSRRRGREQSHANSMMT